MKHQADAGVDAGMDELAWQHLCIAFHHVGAHKHPELRVRDAPAALQAARHRHKVLDGRQLLAGDGALLAIALQPPTVQLSHIHAAAHLQGLSVRGEEHSQLIGSAQGRGMHRCHRRRCIPDLQPHCEGPEILSLELLDLRIYIRPHLHSTAVSQALSACLTTPCCGACWAQTLTLGNEGTQ